jgi:hypothetical protein
VFALECFVNKLLLSAKIHRAIGLNRAADLGIVNPRDPRFGILRFQRLEVDFFADQVGVHHRRALRRERLRLF